MTSAFDGFNWVVRFEKDELLVAEFTKLVKQEQLGGAWVLGLGAVQWAELGFYNLTSKAYQWKRFDQLMELTSLQGNVAWEGDEPVLHLHGTFAGADMQAFGGHIKEMQVAGTCELFLHRWQKDKLTRTLDPATGLKPLDI